MRCNRMASFRASGTCSALNIRSLYSFDSRAVHKNVAKTIVAYIAANNTSAKRVSRLLHEFQLEMISSRVTSECH